MMRDLTYKIFAIALLIIAGTLAGTVEAEAQYLKERGLVRQGNSSFEKRNYRTSLNRYNQALEHDSTSYEALYNRANAHHQLRRSTPQDSTLQAETTYSYYEQIASDELLSTEQRAEVLRNLGESLFADEKYEAALNAFRESLRLNPDDRETKYDYVLTKRIVDQKRQQNQQQQQDNNQNDNNNQQQNQDNQQNQNDQNQNQQDNNQQQNNNQNDQQNQNDQNDPNDQQNEDKQGKDEGDNNGENQGEDERDGERDGEGKPRELSRDQERMLDAIQAEEDKTQDKLKEKKKGILIPGKKNW